MEWLSLPNPVVWQRLIIWGFGFALILIAYLVAHHYWAWATFHFDSLWSRIFVVMVLPVAGIVDHYWACSNWFHFDALAHHEPIILAVACFGFGILAGIFIASRRTR